MSGLVHVGSSRLDRMIGDDKLFRSPQIVIHSPHFGAPEFSVANLGFSVHGQASPADYICDDALAELNCVGVDLRTSL